MIVKIYGYFNDFVRFWAVKNKANLPAFGRKSDNSGFIAGRLLPRVGREIRRKALSYGIYA